MPEGAFVILGQLLITSLLDNPPLLHHDDLIGIADGGQPVSNHDNRHAPFQLFQRFLNPALILTVERACRFVQDQNRRLFKIALASTIR